MKKVIVHQFNMGDVEDPDLWAGQYLYDFEKTEKGKWVMENTIEPTWNRVAIAWGWQYIITALMNDEQYTYYSLKYE